MTWPRENAIFVGGCAGVVIVLAVGMVFANEKVGQNRSSFFIKNCLHLFREQYNICPALWGCSSAGLERLPVTQKVAGSSPVNPATNLPPHGGVFISRSARMRNNILLIYFGGLIYCYQP